MTTIGELREGTGGSDGSQPLGICGFCGEGCAPDERQHDACAEEVYADLDNFVALINAAAAGEAAAALELSRIEEHWQREHDAWERERETAGLPPF